MTIREIKTGQDSFLDIIANLVGILIILVVVVGAQAKQSWVDHEPDTTEQEELAAVEKETEQARLTAQKLIADNRRLEAQIDLEIASSMDLANQRQKLLVQVALAEREIDSKKKELDDEEKVRFDLSVKRASLESQLEEVNTEIRAVKNAKQSKKEAIEHYPTPIAKTVFSNEIHFRLSQGKLAYVPMDELTSRMKSEWKVKAEKLTHSPTTLETIGPIDGFRMQYELESVDVTRRHDQGQTTHQVIRLSRFVLFPILDDVGELLDDALKKDSIFRKKIQRGPAKQTTVSIWVYPDSFHEFNQLKRWLRESGYQTACWPLAHGKMISGGPNGFRTSAQ